MKRQYAYSLCDAMEASLGHELTIPEPCDLVYVGSYFCDKYFCGTSMALWQACMEKIARQGKHSVLVVPTPSQNQLERTKALVSLLLGQYADVISELVLNDYAMLAWTQEAHPGVLRWAGRCLSKETRDPRYLDLRQRAKLYERAACGDLFGIDVCGAEIDPVGAVEWTEAEGRMLGVHAPYVYVSMGRICELSGIGRPIDEKFRLTVGCTRPCVRNWLTYRNHGQTFIKYGRAILTPNGEAAAQFSGDVRIIKSALSDRLAEERRRA